MGELEVVLNGVQFRTRHNDYKMVQKSKTSPDYNAVESLDYPDVPQEVSQHIYYIICVSLTIYIDNICFSTIYVRRILYYHSIKN